jgi:DamX protein
MTTLSADDSYLNHYGFSHDPFASRVPGFKFFPAQRKPVLGQLHHLARYSQLLLVVTGPDGSGKTLLRQALVASSNKQSVQSVVITPQETLDSAALLQQVAQALGSQRADVDSVLAQVIQLALTGQEVYLLVDDAERLTGAAVETLLRLAVGSPEGRPHVFLFGEHSLVARLDALVEGEERFHVIALQPYEEEETREYLELRLEGAGAGLDSLSEDQIARIHEQSEGWPGAINLLARDELLAAMRNTKSKKGAIAWRLPLPMKHLLALVAVVGVVVIALLMRGGEEEPSAPTMTSLPLGAGTEVRSSQDSADAGAPGVSDDRPQPARPLVREPLAAAGGAESDEMAQERSGVPPQSDVTPALPVEPPAVNPPPAPVPAPAPTPAPAPAPQPRVPEAARPNAPQPAPAKPAPSAPPAPASAASVGSWYAGQPATNYLVQVLGTRNESNAKAVVEQYGSGYRYFVKQHEGKPLYVVTHGNFANRGAAVEAIKALPAPLKAGQPWARSFGSVQQEIANAR